MQIAHFQFQSALQIARNVMKSTALVTPSWLPDIERCRHLIESADQFASGFDHHYVLVDAQDEKTFRKVLSREVEIVVKETLLPSWLHQSSLSRKWWWSLRALPVRGWILQQVTKLAITQAVAEEACCFADSDTRFVRPFAAQDLWQGDSLKFFRDERKQHFYESKRYQNWYGFAAKQFGLGDEQQLDGAYIAQLTAMRKDCVAEMFAQIEERNQRGWMDVLLRTIDFSEFILYGVFIDECTNDDRHIGIENGLCHSSWFYDIETPADIEKFVQAVLPNQVAVHLQSNLKMNPDALAVALSA
ncbi:DUF6492 family protein [Pseudomonadales bacterium]|nr:DUF6492 family protein [Pseudomonadales bacterium]